MVLEVGGWGLLLPGHALAGLVQLQEPACVVEGPHVVRVCSCFVVACIIYRGLWSRLAA